MPESDQKFWFHAKAFGYGWGLPASWQGWVVLILYILLVIGTARLGPGDIKLPVISILTVMFIIVVVFTGERPAKWRWGKD